MTLRTSQYITAVYYNTGREFPFEHAGCFHSLIRCSGSRNVSLPGNALALGQLSSEVTRLTSHLLGTIQRARDELLHARVQLNILLLLFFSA